MAYVVEITAEAAEANDSVAEYREEVGPRVRFDSRADAEDLIERFNAAGETVRLRGVHEEHPLEGGQEPVDGYVEVAESEG